MAEAGAHNSTKAMARTIAPKTRKAASFVNGRIMDAFAHFAKGRSRTARVGARQARTTSEATMAKQRQNCGSVERYTTEVLARGAYTNLLPAPGGIFSTPKFREEFCGG